MTRVAQCLVVRGVPEQPAITTVRDDVIDVGCGNDSTVPLTLDAQGMLAQELGAILAPPVAVPPGRCAASSLVDGLSSRPTMALTTTTTSNQHPTIRARRRRSVRHSRFVSRSMDTQGIPDHW